MKRLIRLAIAAVVLLAGAAGAYATETNLSGQPVLPRDAPFLGEGMYSRSSLHPQPEVRPDHMPNAVQAPTSGAMASLARGPVADGIGSSQIGNAGGEGGALMAPRGSAMASPRTRADRQIRLLIKRLD